MSPNDRIDPPLVTRILVTRILAIGFALALSCYVGQAADAQTVYTPNPGGPSVQGGVTTGPPVQIPQTNLTPVAPPTTTYTPPPNAYGSFDPYASTPPPSSAPIPGINSSLGPGVTTIAPPTAPTSGGLFGLFSGPTTPTMAPAGYGNPGLPPVDNPPIYGNPPFQSSSTPGVYAAPPPLPNSVYPQSTPSSLFPEGFGTLTPSVFQSPQYSAFRLLQGPRFRYSFVPSDSGPRGLGINDFDFGVAFAFPNFLHSSQPIFVVPSFSLHLWDGPDGVTGADLPSKSYSAFFDIGWESDPNKMVGTEFGFRFGLFTDFDTYNSDSWRFMGKGLVNFRLTPTSTFKAGVYYADRNEIKLVPAVGIFCRPNPFTRIDLFFPVPKYARYCRTVGLYDVWWYVTGELGGGNWTVTRDAGYEDSVDINDLRAILGVEWGQSQAIQAGRRTAFAEIGYVFNRELKYRYSPFDDIDNGDSVMFRVGIGY